MFLAGICTIGYASAAFSQQPLPEVTVTAANYKYLKTVGGKEVAAVHCNESRSCEVPELEYLERRLPRELL